MVHLKQFAEKIIPMNYQVVCSNVSLSSKRRQWIRTAPDTTDQQFEKSVMENAWERTNFTYQVDADRRHPEIWQLISRPPIPERKTRFRRLCEHVVC